MTNEPALAQDAPLPEGKVGIIDIGSNSIRLVIYDRIKRAPVPLYNEKVLCALGKGLANTGVLHPDGVMRARNALRRFITLGHNMGIEALYAFATAAVRDAKDGRSFVEHLEKTHNIKIEIMDGEKEAQLGAHGVFASMYRPSGIIADLGGGSLEIVRGTAPDIEKQVSLPLGTLRLSDESQGNPDLIRDMTREGLLSVGWLAEKRSKYIYAVGGSFRALAKMHIHANNYPLHIMHNYKVSTKSFLSFLKVVSKMPQDKLAAHPGVTNSRLAYIPSAAIVLEQLIQSVGASAVVFSTSGIREGYLFDKLTSEQQHIDGVIAASTEFANKYGQSTSYANELFTWMFPLVIDESDEERRLRLAACLLHNIASRIHPEFRAEWAYHRILYSAITGLKHRERVKLALALYHCYQFKFKHDWPTLSLLKKGDHEWARLIGTAANLAYHLSGGVSGNLHRTGFVVDGKQVSLHLSGAMEDIMGDAIQRRIDGVRGAYTDYLKLKK